MASTDFGATPLTEAQALTRLATLDPDETRYDGNTTLTIQAAPGPASEFPAGTSVYYVNGIGNTMADQIAQAATYAGEIHGDVRLIHVATYGLPSDLEKATAEKLDSGYADRQPPEEAVARAVLAHVSGTPQAPAFTGEVHFAAHSRGALVVERGLELAESDLERAGYSKNQVSAMFAKIGVETFGGAAASLPDGIRALHYVNDHDPVALAFGMGPVTARTVEAVAAIGAFNSYAAAFVTGYEVERVLMLQPQGPVVLERGKDEADLVDELLTAHGISGYLAARTPFEQTRAASLGHDAAAEARASLVQSDVDRLRSSGAANLPDVVRADPWAGKAASGTVARLDETHVAMHVGRGAYVTLDVGRDLGGRQPADGLSLAITATGRETAQPAHSRS